MNTKIVYFAGKVSKGGGYRGKLLGNKRVMSLGYSAYKVGGGELIYGGPFALSCDHGCFHGKNLHGVLDWTGGHGCEGEFIDGADGKYATTGKWQLEPPEAVMRCLSQIRDCHAVHAYIENFSCYGTLVELGYASALAKPIYIYVPFNTNRYKNLWFAYTLPSVRHFGVGTETSIHPDLLTKIKTYKERYYEYLKSPEWDVKRKAKLKEADYKCQLCNGNGTKIAVHHRTYDRVFNELLADLIALCEPCHQKFHDKVPVFE